MKKSALLSQRLCKDIFILLFFCCAGVVLIGVSERSVVVARVNSAWGSDNTSDRTGQKGIRGKVQNLQNRLPVPNPYLVEGFQESAENWKEIRENKRAAKEAEKGLLEEDPVKPEKKVLPKSPSPVIPSSQQKTATATEQPHNPSQEPKTPLNKSGPFKRKRTDSLQGQEMSSKTGPSIKRKRPASGEPENKENRPPARKRLKVSKKENPPNVAQKPKSFTPKFSTPKRSVSSMRIPSPRKIK